MLWMMEMTKCVKMSWESCWDMEFWHYNGVTTPRYSDSTRPPHSMNGTMWCYSIWCNTVWCNEMWCNIVWCNAMWCNLMWCNVVWCNTMW